MRAVRLTTYEVAVTALCTSLAMLRGCRRLSNRNAPVEKWPSPRGAAYLIGGVSRASLLHVHRVGFGADPLPLCHHDSPEPPARFHGLGCSLHDMKDTSQSEFYTCDIAVSTRHTPPLSRYLPPKKISKTPKRGS